MRIAHCVEWYAPSIGGMQEVVRQLSERMVKAGHEVTVFTTSHPERKSDLLNGVRIRSFPIIGNAVLGIQGDTSGYTSALRDGAYDVVTFFAAQQWTADVMLPHLHELSAVKVFVPTGFSALHDPRYATYYQRMPDAMRAMDLNIFLSDSYQDITFGRSHGVTSTVLIPNGASEEEFLAPLSIDIRKKYAIPHDALLIVHIGSFTGTKGHWDAIRIFLAAKRTKGATLLLIGNGNEELAREFAGWRHLPKRIKAVLNGRSIRIVELDRAHAVAALRQADLFLFPSAIECSPIVLFESMAAGVPFLASNAGNSAEIVQWTGAGRIMPGTRSAEGWEQIDAKGSGALLDALLADREMLRAMGKAGHAAWKERYTWRRIADAYLLQYERLLKQRHG
jgi:glycosyltransferase involved in cell wall biosynthesis